MAIYHFNAQVISRGQGRSAVAAAAYRSASLLSDERTGQSFDYRQKLGVVASGIAAPASSPAWVQNRHELWNRVEKGERRCDAQLAREFNVALPVELSPSDQQELLETFLREHFVSVGAVADWAIHHDDLKNPHAHVMVTMRRVDGEGFGPKERAWNDRRLLLSWRDGWAQSCNRSLALAGHEARIDARSYEAQGIRLVPGIKIGPKPVGQRGIYEDRVAAQQEVLEANGDAIALDPRLALEALTRQRSTFTYLDAQRWLSTHTGSRKQQELCLERLFVCQGLVRLSPDARGAVRFTSQEMLTSERRLLALGRALAPAKAAPAALPFRDITALERTVGVVLSDEQRQALLHVLSPSRRLSLVEGVAGSGKSTLLKAADVAWKRDGYQVVGGALAGAAAANLEASVGLSSRTLAAWERHWQDGGTEGLGKKSVFVLDEAGLVGTRQLERVLSQVQAHGGRVVLVGDAAQLQAIDAGAPFRALSEACGSARLSVVRRQHVAWQQRASEALSRGEVSVALEAYERKGALQTHETQAEAREALVAAWARDAEQAQRPGEDGGPSQLLLAYRRTDVRALNETARAWRQARGELGESHTVQTERGLREFATGDRVQFLRNDRWLGVVNGSLGTLEALLGARFVVRLDGPEERTLVVDLNAYAHLEHGYASTVHKAQGVTVDKAYVLTSKAFDRHASYVAMTRHRDTLCVATSVEEFATPQAMAWTMARERRKDLAHDYIEAPTLRRQMLSLAAVPAPGFPAADKLREMHRIDVQFYGREAKETLERAQRRQRESSAEKLREALPEVQKVREAMQQAECDAVQVRRRREEYQREHPMKSKLGLGQPRMWLSSHDEPLRLSTAERMNKAELRLTTERLAYVRGSVAVRLQVEAQQLQAKEQLASARACSRDIAGISAQKDRDWQRLTPEQQLESLQALKRETQAQRANRRSLTIEDVPAVQVARARLAEAQGLMKQCETLRRDYSKAHPIRAALGLSEPRLDDVVRQQPDRPLSRVEAGLPEETRRRQQAVQQALNWPENRLSARTLIFQQLEKDRLGGYRLDKATREIALRMEPRSKNRGKDHAIERRVDLL